MMCKTMLSFIWSYRASKVKIVFGIQILQLIPAFSSQSRSDGVAGAGSGYCGLVGFWRFLRRGGISPILEALLRSASVCSETQHWGVFVFSCDVSERDPLVYSHTVPVCWSPSVLLKVSLHFIGIIFRQRQISTGC